MSSPSVVVHIFETADGRWYWRLTLDAVAGPYPTLAEAHAEARELYPGAYIYWPSSR